MASMASDAFFPFPDVEFAKKAGITAVIQLGGSKDELSINYCNENKLNGIYRNASF
jgi:AICAR transformylase/IMP cyclohydrolase PurH